MSSHLLADVQDVCDRIAILYQGNSRSWGPSRSSWNPAKSQVLTSKLSDDAIREVEAVLKKHGASVRSVSPDRHARGPVPQDGRGKQGPPGPSFHARHQG